MKSSKLILMLLAAAFVSLDVFGAGAAQWAKACEGEGYKSREFTCFDFFFPEKCKAPGAKKAEVEEEVFFTKEEKVERLKTTLKETEEKKLDLDSQLAWLDDTEEEEIKEAKKNIAETEETIKSLKQAIAELDPAFAAKEGITVAKDAGKKGGDAKKDAPKQKEFHEEDTFKYYKVDELNGELETIFRDTTSRLACDDTVNFSVSHAKIYFVTNPKLFGNLKGKEQLTPVRIVSVDKKARSILVFISPAVTDHLIKALGYAVANLILDEHMALSNPKGELCDAFRIGFCAWCADLDAVVEPNKIVAPEYLLENKLLLPSELFLPSKLEDPEKRLYFTRQSKAVVEYIFSASKEKFQKYVETVSGGNSGFRNSFQNLYVSKTWADSYDDFCNDLNFRIFFPLTKEAKDPEALAEWNKAIAEEDASASSGTDKPKKLRKQIKINHGYKRIIYK